jgi:hypothetical protein
VREVRLDLRRRCLARPDPPYEVVQLDPIRPRGAANGLKCLVGVETIALCKDPFGLLDRDAGSERLLELGTPLVGGLRDGEQTPDRGGGLAGGAVLEGLDRVGLGVFGHGGGSYAGLPCRALGSRKGTRVTSQSEREERAAKNELVFRAVNEQILKMTDRLRTQLDDIDIVCECVDTSCVGTIRVVADDFAEFERQDGVFVVLPGHEDENVEDVVTRTKDYVIVRKQVVADAESPAKSTP